jgi:glyoxylase-like metal-dependent hydrolase (beta-lactamase superfamily II)
MRQTTLTWLASAMLLLASGLVSIAAAPGFQKVTGHYYYLESKTEAANTSAVVTTDGVLIIDPPPEAEMPAMLNALKAITSRPIRWVVSTDYRQARNGGAAVLLKQGAAIIGSKELDRLAGTTAVPDPGNNAAPNQAPLNPRFLFGRQMRLFPAGIEIRIIAVKSKAHTAGDIFVYLPGEKVLGVGNMFTPWSYPVIDTTAGEGTALGWIDGLKQLIDSVPLLRSAMPQPKPEPPVVPEPEKTLEEMVAVIPARGTAANLQQMKGMLTAAQKLRTEVSKAMTAGRDRDEFAKSLSTGAFVEYGGLEAFAAQLFNDLTKK